MMWKYCESVVNKQSDGFEVFVDQGQSLRQGWVQNFAKREFRRMTTNREEEIVPLWSVCLSVEPQT